MKLIPSIPSEVEHHKYGEREYYMVYLPGVPPMQIERKDQRWQVCVYDSAEFGTSVVGEVKLVKPDDAHG